MYGSEALEGWKRFRLCFCAKDIERQVLQYVYSLLLENVFEKSSEKGLGFKLKVRMIVLVWCRKTGVLPSALGQERPSARNACRRQSGSTITFSLNSVRSLPCWVLFLHCVIACCPYHNILQNDSQDPTVDTKEQQTSGP